jgi:hypothetical protein
MDGLRPLQERKVNSVAIYHPFQEQYVVFTPGWVRM